MSAPGVRQAPVGRKMDVGKMDVGKVDVGMRSGLVQSGGRCAAATYAVIFALALTLGGCFDETFQRGYVLPEGALEQIRLGASQEQVLIVLGTPSTVATVSGEAFYYISQRAERPISFMPASITDQRVIAVYFDKDRRVQRVASYGIKDGKIFDFISRTTPTAGSELTFLKTLLNSLQNAHLGLPF
jgi:outer membrane protein assembly factor BamE (lipoprotein component of BamABCDE complex)